MSPRALETHALAARILDVSFRLGRFSPAIKPFLRPMLLEKEMALRYWDFDYLLQRRLYGLLSEFSSPDEIVRSGLERWIANLADLLDSKRRALAEMKAEGRQPDPDRSGAMSSFWAVFGHLVEAGKSLLYIGAGSGRECIQFAARGMRVVGIDTNTPLLSLARDWADFLGSSAQFVGMDLMALGFRRGSFDRAVLEFYGSWPTLSQTIAVQRQFARALKPDGYGLISAARKCYASYWYIMEHGYPVPMMTWLAEHSLRDLYFTGKDGREDRLSFGLFNRSNTVETLARELAHTFDVVVCQHSPDLRYLQAIVKPRPDVDLDELVGLEDALARPAITRARVRVIQERLNSVEALCDMLETHTGQVLDCFENGMSHVECVTSVQLDLDRCVALLESAMA